MDVVLDPAQQAAASALDSLLDRDGRPLRRGGGPVRGGRAEGGRVFGISRGRRLRRGNRDVDQSGQPAELTARSGIYLHGRPGRGKTMVMDRFFARVDAQRKRRFHFHTFFAALHATTHELGSIERAIDELLGDADLVCFDEFHVNDIGDAMLIARLLDALFAGRRTLVVTSNYRPHDLLPNPLFHDRFVPTIEQILAHLTVVTLDGPLDYRSLAPTRTTGFASGRYVITPGPASARPSTAPPVDLGNGRTIRAHTTPDTITVDFHHLCAVATSPADYLHLTRRFQRWTLHSVPRLREVPPDWSMRLVNLVDVLYDADLPLTILAPEPAHELTTGVPAIPDLTRAASRLSELSLTEATGICAAQEALRCECCDFCTSAPLGV
ncbi:cell division protein ZapE [Nocardia lasii]|uniref:Cell division protein ZapE n=1 Tax=Nocardia lasii TaxID=1616107 RepID=A0ABW1JLZ4_9NOCA